MSIPSIIARAGHLIRNGDIPIEAVTPALDTECYRCGVALAATQGRVCPSKSKDTFSLWGLYCDECANPEGVV